VEADRYGRKGRNNMASLNRVLTRWDTNDQAERPCCGQELGRRASEAETVAEEGGSRLRVLQPLGFMTGLARGLYGPRAGFLP
jgi:hypothetical protein